MLNILVTGSNGQLGSELKSLSNDYKYSFFFTDRNSLDITNEEVIKSFVKENSIDTIINCAAYNLVDLAEQEKDLCDLVNHLAVKNLARICNKSKIKLIHFSSDYVFSSNSNNSCFKESRAASDISCSSFT